MIITFGTLVCSLPVAENEWNEKDTWYLATTIVLIHQSKIYHSTMQSQEKKNPAALKCQACTFNNSDLNPCSDR